MSDENKGASADLPQGWQDDAAKGMEDAVDDETVDQDAKALKDRISAAMQASSIRPVAANDLIRSDSGTMEQKPEKGLTRSAESLMETARGILRLGPICDHCLGRQFAKLSTGLRNDERGLAIKIFLGMAASACEVGGEEVLKELAPSSRQARLKLEKSGAKSANEAEAAGVGGCWVCLGLMDEDRLKGLAKAAIDELQRIEYETFHVGTIMSGLLSENEELLLADGASRYAEPLKSELNREVGKIIAERTGKKVDLKRPDVVVHLGLSEGNVRLQISSLYISGRYRKLQRGFPQTRWPCRVCGGSGCERCHQTGRMYQESVDELIRDPIVEAARAEDTVFHGSGREDIDARMLGRGRPFVVEAVVPYRRHIDLELLSNEINRRAAPKVEVEGLAFVGKEKVEELKEAAFDKTYVATVEFASEPAEEKLKSVLSELEGIVEQRTPTRVSHRRADKVRKRKVHRALLNDLSGKTATITVLCDSGLYVKELVSGDGGRTKPSLSESYGVAARVVALDVIDVGGRSNGKVTRDAEKH